MLLNRKPPPGHHLVVGACSKSSLPAFVMWESTSVFIYDILCLVFHLFFHPFSRKLNNKTRRALICWDPPYRTEQYICYSAFNPSSLACLLIPATFWSYIGEEFRGHDRCLYKDLFYCLSPNGVVCIISISGFSGTPLLISMYLQTIKIALCNVQLILDYF